MNILINGIGIADSGGLAVFEKLCQELHKDNHSHKFIFILSDNKNTKIIVDYYKNYLPFKFRLISFSNYFQRIFYENYNFRKILKDEKINLIYNFSGSSQFFNPTPQILKLHNLLFYSKKLDKYYFKNLNFFLWVKHIFIKRIIFKTMLRNAKFIEIQSHHVKSHLADFVPVQKKLFYIKSDLLDLKNGFAKPKRYDFKKKITFLYIVGPHFEYPHKNLIEFSRAMMKLKALGVNFEIDITLKENQINNSKLWNNALNGLTNFYGYLNKETLQKNLFKDNTILISTSVIETIGLHVTEAIQNGIITITPNEIYADVVYGKNRLKYELFNAESLKDVILDILDERVDLEDLIIDQQNYLKETEKSKYNDACSIFNEVTNV